MNTTMNTTRIHPRMRSVHCSCRKETIQYFRRTK